MAIQLPKDAYDTGLGRAISEPLLQLINQKMQHVQQTHERRTTAQNLALLGGVTPEQGWGIAGLPEHLQKIALAKHYDLQKQQGQGKQASNTPYLKSLSEGRETALKIRDIANELQQLDKTGKVSSGYGGSLKGILPAGSMNKETTLYNQKANELVTLLASQEKGNPTKYLLQVIQSQKPNLTQKRSARQQIVKDLLKHTNEPIRAYETAHNLIRENDYREPSSLETRVNELLGYSQPEQNQEQQQAKQSQELGEEQDRSGEGWGQWAGRNIVTTGSHVLGAAAGLPGNIQKGAAGIQQFLAGDQPVRNYLDEALGEPQLQLPSSGDINKDIENRTNGYTKPTSEEEPFYDAFDTFLSLVSPGLLGKAGTAIGQSGKLGKAGELLSKAGSHTANARGGLSLYKPKSANQIIGAFSGPISAKTAAGLTAAGSASDLLSDAFDVESGQKALNKVAFMTAASVLGTRQALKDSLKDKYAQSEHSAFGNATVPMRSVMDRVNNFEKKHITQNLAHHKDMRKIVQEVREGLFEGGSQAKISDLIGQVKNLNTRFRWASQERIPNQKEYLAKDLRAPLGELIDVIKRPIDEAAKKFPKESRPYFEAQDIVKGLNTQGAMTEWLRDNMNTAKFTSDWSKLLVNTLSGVLLHPTERLTKLYDFLNNSPTARQAYKAAIIAAGKQNRNAALQAFEKVGRLADEAGIGED